MNGHERFAWGSAAVLCFGLVAVAGGCAGRVRYALTPRPTPLYLNTEVAPSLAVPRRRVEGVVVDARTGQPLRGVQVYVQGEQKGLLTDSLGRFSIELSSDRRHPLRITQLGFAEQVVALDPAAPQGYAARVSLIPVPLAMCADPVEPYPLVAVLVLDARTGRAPTTPPALEARRGRDRWTQTSRRNARTGAVVLGIDVLAPGPYELQVTAPGYRRWKQRVAVDKTCCGPCPVQLTVWLLPE